MSTLQQISTIYKIEHERAIGELSQKTNIISVFLHFFDLNQKINTYLSELSENIGDCPSLDKSIQALKGWTTYYGCALIK
jgi:hypothetical protein